MLRMNLTINNQAEKFDSALSVKQLLIEKKLDLTTIVVAINGRVVPPEDYAERQLCENDRLEMMTFVGGG